MAKALTARPSAGFGFAPSGQPFAGAMFTVGISVLLGSGIVGLAPTPGSCANLELSPQPASTVRNPTIKALVDVGVASIAPHSRLRPA